LACARDAAIFAELPGCAYFWKNFENDMAFWEILFEEGIVRGILKLVYYLVFGTIGLLVTWLKNFRNTDPVEIIQQKGGTLADEGLQVCLNITIIILTGLLLSLLCFAAYTLIRFLSE
jgi:energy-coupling factor transporter transmembrane protein EcfT